MPATSIIHLATQLDRTANVLALRSQFRAQVFTAHSPDLTAPNRNTASHVGCMRSHLALAESHTAPVLVLESDAAPMHTSPEDIAALIAAAPADCGILLLGGDVFQNGPVVDGFAEVAGRFEGTQALVYFSDRLHSAGWFLPVYRYAFFHPVGECLTPEYIFRDALLSVGLKIYRPARMRFSTVPLVSARNGQVEPPRSLNFLLQ